MSARLHESRDRVSRQSLNELDPSAGLSVLFRVKMVFWKVPPVVRVFHCLERFSSMLGTGKTLSLLCASLAWLEQYKASNTDANGILPETLRRSSR